MSKRKIICPFCFADCDVDLPEKTGGVFPEQYCPKCKSLVPPEVLSSKLFPVAVVGPSASGKTHFLTVLSHLLCEGALWPSYWTVTRIIRRAQPVQDSDPGSGGAYGRKNKNESDDEFVNWEELLYPQKSAVGTILKQTEGRSEKEPPLSLVLHVSYSGRVADWLKEPYRKKDLLLAFTDTAGEDLTHMGWEAVAKKYPIFGRRLAEGLVALINPTQLAVVRNEYNGANAVLKNRYEQSGLKLSAFATLQSVLSIPEIRKAMKRKPVAICLTKTDALCAIDKLDPQDILAGSQNAVSGEDADEGRIRLTDLSDLSSRTEAYLAEMDDDVDFGKGRPNHDGISGSAKFFKYRAFFATDALGPAIQTARLDPADGKRIFAGTPVPRRILDPVLWVLWQHGQVGGRWQK